MLDASRILAFLQDELRQGKRACLVTVTGVTGASVRNPGANMAVSEDGHSIGSLSGGCIEQAVIAEALMAIEAGAPRQLSYGAGSPIIDIRLPCGGRVDLLLTPLCEKHSIDQLIARLESRMPASLLLPVEGATLGVEDGETGWYGEHFRVRYFPPLRLVVAGHGGTVGALVRQASPLGIDCHVVTPDREVASDSKQGGATVRHLSTLNEPFGFELDRWTAIAFFFHDHDWETKLMAEALASPAFYIGAMGSNKTHAERSELLASIGVEQDSIERIAAPIGLIPSSRDPETLALSALAQIVDCYNAETGAQFNPGQA